MRGLRSDWGDGFRIVRIGVITEQVAAYFARTRRLVFVDYEGELRIGSLQVQSIRQFELGSLVGGFGGTGDCWGGRLRWRCVLPGNVMRGTGTPVLQIVR